MTKQKKKPKTGDVVGWVAIDQDGDVRGVSGTPKTRNKAREVARQYECCGWEMRIAKIILAK